MTEGRNIVARAVLAQVVGGGGYVGELVLFGFKYRLLVTRHPDGVLVEADAGVPTAAYRIPVIDGEEDATS